MSLSDRKSDKIKVIAHRGDSLYYPENTLPAFESAAALGVDVIETDVHLTKDGQCVVWHDEGIQRITDQPGLIADLTWDELKQFDAGYNFRSQKDAGYPFRGKGISMVLLRDLLQALPETQFNIDLKPRNPQLVTAFTDILKSEKAVHRVCAASFEDRNIILLRRILPELRTALSPGEIKRLMIHYYTGTLFLRPRGPSTLFQVPEIFGSVKVVTPGTLLAFQKRGFTYEVWTVNEASRMEHLIRMGVNGIFTDNPRLLLNVLGR